MKNNFSFIIGAIILVLIFALGAYGVYYLYQKKVVEPQIAPLSTPKPNHGFPVESPSTSLRTGPLASPSGGMMAPPATQPEAGSNTVEVKNIGITVDSPKSGDLIMSPVKVAGHANVFEGNVVIEIIDANGAVLGSGTATACMDVDACPFEASVSFKGAQTASGTVEVYSPSAKDGSKQYLQTIPVNF